MSVQVIDNFSYKGKKGNFERDNFDTLQAMRSYPEDGIDDGHVCFCNEDGNHYKFNHLNSVDGATGRWRLHNKSVNTLTETGEGKVLDARQGKILKDLIDAKVIEAGGVSFDTVPTKGSTNPVTSNGIKEAMDEQAESINANTGVDEYPVFSASTAYSAGDVVNYNGKLYQFTADHAAGAFDEGQVEETSLKGELEGEIRALSRFINDGFLDNRGQIANMFPNSFLCTDFLKIDASYSIIFKAATTNQYLYYICFYDADKKFISGLSNTESVRSVNTIHADDIPKGTVYIRLCDEANNSDSFVSFVQYENGVNNCIIDTPLGNNIYCDKYASKELYANLNDTTLYKLPIGVKRNAWNKFLTISKRETDYYVNIRFCDKNNNIVSEIVDKREGTFSIPEDCDYIIFHEYGYVLRNGLKTMINYGEEIIEYEPYKSLLLSDVTDIENLKTQNSNNSGFVQKFFNLFNKDDSDYKENYFINKNGDEETNEYTSAFAVTGYMKLPSYFDCISINYIVGVSNTNAALYDINKKFLCSVRLTDTNRQIDYIEGAYYARFTIYRSKKDTTMIVVGLCNTDIAYTSYKEVYSLDEDTDKYIRNIANQYTPKYTPKYDNKFASSISEGEELVLSDIPDDKNHYGIGCSFNTDNMGVIKIFKSQDDYCRGEIDIDSTNITEYTNGGVTSTIAHGLEISNGLIVYINKKENAASITLINTAGQKVVKTLSKWIGCKGNIVKFIAVSGNYNNVALTHNAAWADKSTWIFGDSYTDFWPSKCYANGASNFYLDGYSGRNSQAGYNSLILALKYGRPKRIVWMLGMNDGDNDSSVDENWNSIFNSLKVLCEKLSIQLIPCTIPNVPNVIHIYINQIIRDSGLPYIDIASILGANEKGSSWFEGLLGSDNVHPTLDKGAEVIANTLIMGVSNILD